MSPICVSTSNGINWIYSWLSNALYKNNIFLMSVIRNIELDWTLSQVHVSMLPSLAAGRRCGGPGGELWSTAALNGRVFCLFCRVLGVDLQERRLCAEGGQVRWSALTWGLTELTKRANKNLKHKVFCCTAGSLSSVFIYADVWNGRVSFTYWPAISLWAEPVAVLGRVL